MAERGGFEPPIRFYPYNSLANCRLQPLGHLSCAISSSVKDGLCGCPRDGCTNCNHECGETYRFKAKDGQAPMTVGGGTSFRGTALTCLSPSSHLAKRPRPKRFGPPTIAAPRKRCGHHRAGASTRSRYGGVMTRAGSCPPESSGLPWRNSIPLQSDVLRG